uniref:IRS-type PTB domain-containing protein n=1 Tax=Globodera pallida TaxID=36090 RepID=A0A183BZH3_GLOPA
MKSLFIAAEKFTFEWLQKVSGANSKTTKLKEKKIGTENSGKLKTKMTIDSNSDSLGGRTAESVTPSVVSDTTKASTSDPPTSSPQHSVSNLDQYGDVLEENPQSEFTTHLRRFTKFNLMGNCCEAFNFSSITAKCYEGKLRLITKGPTKNRLNLPIDGHLLIRSDSEPQKCVWLSKTDYQGYVFEFDTERRLPNPQKCPLTVLAEDSVAGDGFVPAMEEQFPPDGNDAGRVRRTPLQPLLRLHGSRTSAVCPIHAQFS